MYIVTLFILPAVHINYVFQKQILPCLTKESIKHGMKHEIHDTVFMEKKKTGHHDIWWQKIAKPKLEISNIMVSVIHEQRNGRWHTSKHCSVISQWLILRNYK